MGCQGPFGIRLASLCTRGAQICGSVHCSTQDSAKSVPPDTVDKLRKMLAFLDDMQGPEELRSLPTWRVHTLTGDRKGTWSLRATRGRRLTFRIDIAEREICDLNLEDYH